jgi:hypothetical protein
VFFSLSLDGFRLIYEVRIFMDDELNHFFVWCSQVQRIDDCFPYVAIKGIHVSFSIFIGTWKHTHFVIFRATRWSVHILTIVI